MKNAVVYWSGTGNTAAMAEAVVKGMKDAGAEVDLLTSAEFNAAKAKEYDGIAFGCPAMGAEVLEEEEFQPMWDSCKSALTGVKVGLFGSYGWGSGDWMKSWEEDCAGSGITLFADSVICNEAPDDEAISNCMALGAALS